MAIAGGAESLSDIPILHSRRFADTLVALSRARSMGERLKLIGGIRPRDLKPVTPAISEPSTGETMGQSAEKMAKENRIAREDQDAFAVRSHHNAATAKDLIKAIGSYPRVRAVSSPISRTDDAPSVRGEELAAVTDPFLRSKTARSLATASTIC